jgi:hypothetical protein
MDSVQFATGIVICGSCVILAVCHYLSNVKSQKVALPSYVTNPIHRQGLKIVNDKLQGFGGFQYKLGLNTCPHPFSWEPKCCEGGLYYARSEDIYKFLSYSNSPVLLVVTVPPEEKEVVRLGDSWDLKFRSKNLIVEKIFDLKTTSRQELIQNGITTIDQMHLDMIQEKHKS